MRTGTGHPLPPPSAGLRLRQVLAVARLELPRVLLSRHALSVTLLALLAVLPWFLALLFGSAKGPGRSMVEFAGFVETVVVRFFLFIACLLAFGGLVRRELEQRTLHYAFLTPIRRELYMAGKYLASLVAVTLVFSASTLAALALAYLSGDLGAGLDYLLAGPGPGQAAGFLLVVTLATATYGAVFFALGLLVRRPVSAGLLLFVLEWLRPLLPVTLKRLTVSWYVKSFLPLGTQTAPVVGIAASPPATWVSCLVLAGVLAASAAAVVFAVRRLEPPCPGT